MNESKIKQNGDWRQLFDVDKHDCNNKASVLLLSDGHRVENNEKNREKYKSIVIGTSTACSICHKVSIDDKSWIKEL